MGNTPVTHRISSFFRYFFRTGNTPVIFDVVTEVLPLNLILEALFNEANPAVLHFNFALIYEAAVLGVEVLVFLFAEPCTEPIYQVGSLSWPFLLQCLDDKFLLQR